MNDFWKARNEDSEDSETGLRPSSRAVKPVKDGQITRTLIKELGQGDLILRNGVKASAEGKLKGAGPSLGIGYHPPVDGWRVVIAGRRA